MNTYLVYVNGLLAGPEDFKVVQKNSSDLGRFLVASVPADELKSKIKSVDIFEIRASNLVGRFRAVKTDVAEKDAHIVATCKRVDNSF
jgi:hypothetical protein